MKTNEKKKKTPKQPVDVSESEGVLSELCYPVTGYYCVTVVVLEVGPRLAPRDQRSGGDGCRAARGPFPSDPPPFFPPVQKDLKEEARVWEVADVYTPLENQESMLKETKNLKGKRRLRRNGARTLAL